MIKIIKTRREIIFPAIAISLSIFLSGCFYSDQPRENVLRSAEEYKVKNYAERQPPEDPNAARKLTISIQGDGSQKTTDSQKTGAPDSKQPPSMQIDESKTYSAVLKTGKGEITIDLDAKKTPKTVNNFVSLSREGFYNGTIFHRVVKDFMIQGGDPNGDGSGGPGYKFDDENLEGDYKRGTVAMANSGPNTNGSQFFIIHKDYDLTKSYVVFGHVSKGMEVVDKIAEGETVDNGSGEKSKPVSPVKIDSVEVVEK
ncbi:MAG: peptidylprolyl isomerase [Patescibacteria group bacterium]|nr:peptidylprolyl isomerase [Patescibacteria group bacterium]